jgi:saccharopine dehydrogenase (NAD+, L-lysine-forming)
MKRDVVVLCATGTMGRLIAAELAERGVSLVLAGRDEARLAQVSPGAATAVVDLTDPASLRAVCQTGRVVVNTVGPFATLAPPVVDACLDTGTGYVDIGNELPAVQALLDLDADARAAGVTLVTGAGFGLAVTESLLLTLGGGDVASVRVVAAPHNAYDTEGVRSTVAATIPEGAAWYEGGELVRAPLGTGVATVSFAGTEWTAFPAPLGDLLAARLITGADSVRALRATESDGISHAYAEITGTDGQRRAAELSTGEGFAVTAAIAAATATRLLEDTEPGAWTPCRLLGPDLVTALPGTTITPAGPR